MINFLPIGLKNFIFLANWELRSMYVVKKNKTKKSKKNSNKKRGESKFYEKYNDRIESIRDSEKNRKNKLIAIEKNKRNKDLEAMKKFLEDHKKINN